MGLGDFFSDEDGLLGGMNAPKGPKPKRLRAGLRAVERRLTKTPSIKLIAGTGILKKKTASAKLVAGSGALTAGTTKAPQIQAAINAVRLAQQVQSQGAPAAKVKAAVQAAQVAVGRAQAAVKGASQYTATSLFAPSPSGSNGPARPTARFARALSGLGEGLKLDMSPDGQLPDPNAPPSADQVTTQPDPAAPDGFGISLNHRPAGFAWVTQDLWASWPDSAVPHTNGVRWQHRVAFPAVDNTAMADAASAYQLSLNPDVPGENNVNRRMLGQMFPIYGGSGLSMDQDPQRTGYNGVPIAMVKGEISPLRADGHGRSSPLDGRDLDWSSSSPRPDSAVLATNLYFVGQAGGHTARIAFETPMTGGVGSVVFQPEYGLPSMAHFDKWPADFWRLDLADDTPTYFMPWGVPIDLLSHYVANDRVDGQPGFQDMLGDWLKRSGYLPGYDLGTVIGIEGNTDIRVGYPPGVGSLTVYNPDGTDFRALLTAKGIMGPQSSAQPTVVAAPVIPDVAPLDPNAIDPMTGQPYGAALDTGGYGTDTSGMLPGPGGGDVYDDGSGAGITPDGGGDYYQPDGGGQYDDSYDFPTSGMPPADEGQVVGPSFATVQSPGAPGGGIVPQSADELPADASDFSEFRAPYANEEFANAFEDEEIGMVPDGFDMDQPTFDDGPIPFDNVEGWGEDGF